MYSEIKFKISKERDFKTLLSFIEEGNIFMIKCAFLSCYPELENYIKKNNEKFYITDLDFMQNFISKEYDKNIDLIEENMVSIEKTWRKKQHIFFELVNELFDEKYWGEDSCTAFSTIWGLYPRFIKERCFQIPVRGKDKDYVLNVIAHEMLHFIFYNYFLENYKEYNMNNNSFLIWNASESFNEIIQWHSKWIKEFKVGPGIYGGRESIDKKLQEKYNKLNAISSKELIDDIIKEIKDSKTLMFKD